MPERKCENCDYYDEDTAECRIARPIPRGLADRSLNTADAVYQFQQACWPYIEDEKHDWCGEFKHRE